MSEHVRVAIVGAGPAGVGAAVKLCEMGVGPIAVIEREKVIGGIPARYTSDDVPTYVMWTRGRVIPGYRFADRLRKELEGTDVAVHLGSMVASVDPETRTLTVVSPGRGVWQLTADAIVFATGARESSRSERGWIYGHRPAGVHFTTNMLDFGGSASADAAIIGSEVMGYAAAAKLRRAGAGRVTVTDDAARPRSWLPKRLFFYRWARPAWVGRARCATVRGSRRVEGLEFADGSSADVGQVAITGVLVPNSELLAEAGFEIEPGMRRVRDVTDYRLDASGIFLAGNVLGLSCSGQWAYWTGKWAAARVAKLTPAR